MSTVLQILSDYGARQAREPLDAEVAHHAKRALIDWLASHYPGTREPLAAALLRAHADELGVGRSRLPGMGARSFAATAAWINGSVSHYVEFDDIFKDAAYHPGCPTISAALAVADQIDAAGGRLLNAITIGYEISTRVGAVVQPSHYRYFHTTGTAGCLGAAAAAAALLAPGDARVLCDALANATTFASGLQQAFRSDSMTKPLHAGHAAMVGVRVAAAAACGVTGAADILEGEAGFGAALSDGADWAKATEALGSRYNITAMTQKNHGCCGHTFAPIDAALELRRSHGFGWQDIASIEIATYRTALDVTGNFEPRTVAEAKFSLPYVLCHALIHGSVRLDAFGDDRLSDARIRALMKRTTLREDPQFSARFPVQRAATVTIALNDGRRVEHFAPCRKGDPEAPLSDQEIESKFIELTAPVLGDQPCRALLAQLWEVDRMPVAQLVLG